MKKVHLLVYGYYIIIVGLFLYSYTQVDLSLTLSRASLYQTIEKWFQYVGYFNRPLSTVLYCAILAFLFLFYFIFLRITKEKALSKKAIWRLVIFVSVLLTFSYNAFSYDLFNYIFAAKVVVHYHQNPYVFTALDFPKEPMLSFMHWTHNTYQYGPVWLGITLPFYFFGLGYFLPTFYLFKALATLSFLGSVYFFQKILHKIQPEREAVATILYALNPLIIIELLVSSHNDSTMMLLGLMGVYFALQKKWMWGILAIILSALTKEVTVLLLFPTAIFMLGNYVKSLHAGKWRNFFSETYFLYFSSLVLFLAFLYASWKIGVQPWYAAWFLPFCFLIKLPRFLTALLIGLSLGLLLRYVPFLWQGDWNGMALVIMPVVTIATPLLFLLSVFIYNLFSKKAA